MNGPMYVDTCQRLEKTLLPRHIEKGWESTSTADKF